MEFNQLVLQNILPFLKEYGLGLIEENENYFRFKSEFVEIGLSYNKFDRTSLFEIGKPDSFLFPLNDKLILEVLGLHLRVNFVSKEQFIENLVQLLKLRGKILLKDNENILFGIKTALEKESKDYTNQILRRQLLAAADIAWNDGKYREYLSLLDRIGKNKLPASYLLKYNFAIRQMNLNQKPDA